jgi:ATP-dependent exoDNAse (exonuclease V) alpha subunit
MKKQEVKDYFRDVYCVKRSTLFKRGFNQKYEGYEEGILEDIRLITENVFVDLFLKGTLTKCDVEKIVHYVFQTKQTSMLLHRLLYDPFMMVYVSETILIRYKRAFNIANYYNITPEYDSQLRAWTFDYILKCSKNSSFYISENELKQAHKKEFDKTPLQINILADFCIKKIFYGEEYYTLNKLFNIEKNIVSRLIESNYKSEGSKYENSEYVNNIIEIYEEKNKKTLNKVQKDVIHRFCTYNINIVSGFPGTGKSMIVDVYCKYIEEVKQNEMKELKEKHGEYETETEKRDKYKIFVIAPTGMAVKNIREKIDEEYRENITICTIHKLIYKYYGDYKKKIVYKEDNKKNEFTNYGDYKEEIVYKEENRESELTNIHTLIMDESSMVDLLLFDEIMKIVEQFDCKLIMLGDKNQLPPIGVGEPFKYMINSKKFIVTDLKKIMRQDKSILLDTIKNIITNPEKVKNCEKGFTDESLKYENLSNEEFSEEVLSKIIEKYKLDENNSKFISPSNNSKVGVTNMNDYLQLIYEKKRKVKTDEIIQNRIDKGEYYDGMRENYEMKEIKIMKYKKTKVFKYGDLLLLTMNKSHKIIDENGKKFLKSYVNGDYAIIKSWSMKEIDFKKEDEKENIEEKKFEKKYVIKYNGEDVGMNDDLTLKNNEYEIGEDELYDQHQLGYCTTVHKLQGSQYENIVIILDKEDKYQWSNDSSLSLFYTAISRAKNRCILVGDIKMMNTALQKRDKKEILTSFFELLGC